jgi:hypothetical protein
MNFPSITHKGEYHIILTVPLEQCTDQYILGQNILGENVIHLKVPRWIRPKLGSFDRSSLKGEARHVDVTTVERPDPKIFPHSGSVPSRYTQGI